VATEVCRSEITDFLVRRKRRMGGLFYILDGSMRISGRDGGDTSVPRLMRRTLSPPPPPTTENEAYRSSYFYQLQYRLEVRRGVKASGGGDIEKSLIAHSSSRLNPCSASNTTLYYNFCKPDHQLIRS